MDGWENSHKVSFCRCCAEKDSRKSTSFTVNYLLTAIIWVPTLLMSLSSLISVVFCFLSVDSGRGRRRCEETPLLFECSKNNKKKREKGGDKRRREKEV